MANPWAVPGSRSTTPLTPVPLKFMPELLDDLRLG